MWLSETIFFFFTGSAPAVEGGAFPRILAGCSWLPVPPSRFSRGAAGHVLVTLVLGAGSNGSHGCGPSHGQIHEHYHSGL